MRLVRDHQGQMGCTVIAPTWLGWFMTVLAFLDFAMTPSCHGLLRGQEGFLLCDSPSLWILHGQYLQILQNCWDQYLVIHSNSNFHINAYARFRTWWNSNCHLTKINQNDLKTAYQLGVQLLEMKTSWGIAVIFEWHITPGGHEYFFEA